MSQRLISRNDDLRRLRNEGYNVQIVSTYLVVRDVPYVNARREVQRGALVCQLDLAGEATTKPSTHVTFFAGEYPCNRDGSPIRQLEHQSQQQQLAADLVVHHSFSNKPAGGYVDFYEKVTTYVRIISHPAAALEPSASATTFPAIPASADESIFHYMDTASSRAGILTATERLELDRIAIVGLGGTGSYVLDLVAKTPVKEIHLFDGDAFQNHNAFRSPGAASIEELQAQPTKVAYLTRTYSKMHRGIVSHECNIDDQNVGLLEGSTFVFLCLDKGSVKGPIIRYLEEQGIPFLDVGMGIDLDDQGTLGGQLRLTLSTNQQRQHVHVRNRIPLADGDVDDVYSRNIQIADLNALNAALAVVKWKKWCGFYRDLEREHFSVYTTDGNNIINEDQHE
jgi:hypothetical protein